MYNTSEGGQFRTFGANGLPSRMSPSDVHEMNPVLGDLGPQSKSHEHFPLGT